MHNGSESVRFKRKRRVAIENVKMILSNNNSANISYQSSDWNLNRKLSKALVVHRDLMFSQVLPFNTLAPVPLDKRGNVLVRRLGFIFATMKAGQMPGLVGISQEFITVNDQKESL